MGRLNFEFDGVLMNIVRVISFFVTLIFSCSFAMAEEENIVKAQIVTELGVIKVDLYPDRAPITVGNFIKNVDAKIYNYGRFYRVSREDNTLNPIGDIINIIQGGRGEHIKDVPPIEHETTDKTGISHQDGVLSMARGAPGTATTDFFISIGDNSSLDTGTDRYPEGYRQGYATFGRVTDGMDIVIDIHGRPSGDTAKGPNVWMGKQTLNDEVIIERIEIIK